MFARDTPCRRCLLTVVVCSLMVLASATAAHADPDCRPTVVVDGDGPHTAAVRARLVAIGVAATTTEACATIRVRVVKDDAFLVIAIADAYGRTSERRVRDAQTAAVIVESWIQQEVFLPQVAATVEPVASQRPVETLAAVAAAPVTVALLHFSLGPETAVGIDGSLWLGVRANGCARVGPVCVGAGLRFGADTATTAGMAADQTINFLGGDAVATVELPLRLGSVAVTPGVNAGLTWVQRREKTIHANPQPQTDLVTDNFARFRLGAQLGFAMAIGRGFSLRALLGVDQSLPSDAPGPGGFARVQFALGYRVK